MLGTKSVIVPTSKSNFYGHCNSPLLIIDCHSLLGQCSMLIPPIKSLLATDYFERDNPLTFPITRFSRVGRGLEGCRPLNKWWPMYISIPIIWDLWVRRVCSCAPSKPRKPIIERIVLQWLLETLFQCLSFTRSVVFSPLFFIVQMFLWHLFISCRMDEVDRIREAIRQRRSAQGLGSFLEVQTFLSTRHSRRYQERIRSELRELLLLESGTSNYWLDNCAARAAWHILIFDGACTDFPWTDGLLHHKQNASHLGFMFRYSVSVDWTYKDNHFLNHFIIESTALWLFFLLFGEVHWIAGVWYVTQIFCFLHAHMSRMLSKYTSPRFSLVTYWSV